jgi:tRNA(adenine34) deaminase
MTDQEYIKKAIELSEKSFDRRDMPIGCVIATSQGVIAESENYALSNKDFTQHAEVLCMLSAAKKLGKTDLSECTLYSSMEPCPMCSLLIREYRISKVVFSLISEDMGGMTKYQILQDKNLSDKFPNHFGDVPKIEAGLLKDDAQKVWARRKAVKANGEMFKLAKY